MILLLYNSLNVFCLNGQCKYRRGIITFLPLENPDFKVFRFAHTKKTFHRFGKLYACFQRRRVSGLLEHLKSHHPGGYPFCISNQIELPFRQGTYGEQGLVATGGDDRCHP